MEHKIVITYIACIVMLAAGINAYGAARRRSAKAYIPAPQVTSGPSDRMRCI